MGVCLVMTVENTITERSDNIGRLGCCNPPMDLDKCLDKIRDHTLIVRYYLDAMKTAQLNLSRYPRSRRADTHRVLLEDLGECIQDCLRDHSLLIHSLECLENPVELAIKYVTHPKQ